MGGLGGVKSEFSGYPTYTSHASPSSRPPVSSPLPSSHLSPYSSLAPCSSLPPLPAPLPSVKSDLLSPAYHQYGAMSQFSNTAATNSAFSNCSKRSEDGPSSYSYYWPVLKLEERKNKVYLQKKSYIRAPIPTTVTTDPLFKQKSNVYLHTNLYPSSYYWPFLNVYL